MEVLVVVLSGCAGLVVILAGVIMRGYDKRIEKAEEKAEHIESNYNDKFKTTHEKLDKLINMYHAFDKKLDKQINFCEFKQKLEIE